MQWPVWHRLSNKEAAWLTKQVWAAHIPAAWHHDGIRAVGPAQLAGGG